MARALEIPGPLNTLLNEETRVKCEGYLCSLIRVQQRKKKEGKKDWSGKLVSLT